MRYFKLNMNKNDLYHYKVCKKVFIPTPLMKDLNLFSKPLAFLHAFIIVCIYRLLRSCSCSETLNHLGRCEIECTKRSGTMFVVI